jgi:hypothetical protein
VKPPKDSADAEVIHRADDMALIVEARGLLVHGGKDLRTKTQLSADVLRTLPPAPPSSFGPDRARAAFLDAHRETTSVRRH